MFERLVFPKKSRNISALKKTTLLSKGKSFCFIGQVSKRKASQRVETKGRGVCGGREKAHY